MKFYSDDQRHLVCYPYSVEGLHQMARELGIKRCWYHASPSGAHYDIPKRRIQEIQARTIVVSSRTILLICRGHAPV